ncbi:hypothetical protein M404DRAFT_1005847, partial [Pisolithus tinctorius Marx 270]
MTPRVHGYGIHTQLLLGKLNTTGRVSSPPSCRTRILVIFALRLLLFAGYSMIGPCWFRARTDMASGWSYSRFCGEAHLRGLLVIS